MSRNKKAGPIDRREFFARGAKYGLMSALSANGLLGLPLWPADSHRRSWLNSYDSFQRLQSLGQQPQAWFGVAKAMAQANTSQTPVTLVTIKVLNHVFSPLVFAPGKLEGGANQLAANIVKASTRAGAGRNMLLARGADRISDMPRFAKLRFNKWFADLLYNGTADGAPRGAANLISGIAADTGLLSEDKVALQAFLHLKQIAGQNHSLKGTKLRQNLPDLALFAEQYKLIQSPLGITALMMGGEYDKAEGTVPFNAVLGDNSTETIVVQSRRVRDLVAQLTQSVGAGYVSRQAFDQNTTVSFDKLIDPNATLRKDMLASLDAFRGALGRFASVASFEAQQQVFSPDLANGQSSTPGNGASFEFLAQCQYVAESMRLPGRPLRNFSLFLNINDLDGKDLDAVTNQVNPGQDERGVRALTYIEGMRQLALGLNVFGKLIANGERLVVTVVSEGGRGAAMEDSKTSFALVMGPKGPGLLDDMLYADMNGINQSSGSVVADLAAEAAAVAWTTDEGLRSKAGSRVTNTVASVGDVQMGVVEFLEQLSGQSARTGLTSEDGQYARLKRYGS